MPTTIILGDNDFGVTLTLECRPFPEAKEPWDRDAIDAQVEVFAGAFRGCFSTTIWSHEIAHLAALLQELDRRVGQASTAVFRLRENTLELRFFLGESGTLKVSVRVIENPAGSCTEIQKRFLNSQLVPLSWSVKT